MSDLLRHDLVRQRDRMAQVRDVHSVDASDVDPASLDRRHSGWRPVLRLARLFLDGMVPAPTHGEIAAWGFWVDMPALFEAAVSAGVRRAAWLVAPSRSRWRVVEQDTSHQLVRVRRDDGCWSDALALRPDIVVHGDASPPLILDAKYKRLDPLAPAFGISNADAYQMLAYAHRYGASRVVLVYPEPPGAERPVRGRLEVRVADGGRRIAIEVVTVRTPQGHDFRSIRDEFAKELAQALLGTTAMTPGRTL